MNHSRVVASACLSMLAVTAACSSAPAPASSGEVTSSTSEALTTVYGTSVCSAGSNCVTPAGSPDTCPPWSAPVVTYNPGSWNGFVLTSPSIYLVHWGAYWTTQPGLSQAAADVAAWKAIGTDARFWQPLAEYSPPGGPTIAPATVAPGQIRYGATTDPSAVASLIGNVPPGGTAQIPTDVFEKTLVGELTDGVLPSPTTQPNTIWVVILPPGVSVGTVPDAYHSSVNISGLNYPYAAIPGSGATPGDTYFEGQNPFFPTAKMRGQDIAISHEIYEAVTDSAWMGWYAAACLGQEVGDLCEGLVTDPIDGYTVSSFWSNAANGCVGPVNLNTSTPTMPSCGCSKNKDTLAQTCSGTLCCPKGAGDCGGYCCKCVGTTCM